jgi:hypothetical protein
MSHHPPTFMAPQRTQYAINSNKSYYGSSQSWTAGRCQRLLRPLTSRIELLAKDAILYTTAAKPGSVSTLATPATAPNNKYPDVSSEREEETKYKAKRRKRVRRTYSARSRLKNILHEDQVYANQEEREKNPRRKVKSQPGEVLVPTPILNRSKFLVADPSQDFPLELSPIAPLKSRNVKRPSSQQAAQEREAQFEFAEIMRQIKKTASATRFKVYEGICNSLEALFKATLPQEERASSVSDTMRTQQDTFSLVKKVPRSSSLLAMCLRGIPDYIRKEEKRLAIEAEAMGPKSAFDTPLVSIETYTDLESLGTSDTGWKHLRTVVRAHGVLVISDAIEHGLLDANIASALVMLCLHTSLPDEAEMLLTSLIKSSSIYPDPKSPQSHFRDDPALLPLLTLMKFVKYTGRFGYYHRQITGVITTGSLSVTWLGTKCFSSLWTSLFRSLSIDPFDRDANKFMNGVLPLVCRAQSSRLEKHEHSSSDQSSMLSVLDTTRASVLTTLLAMSMLSVRLRSIPQTLKATIIDCQLGSSELQSHGISLILMANLLRGAETDEDASFLKRLVGLLRSKSCESLNLLQPCNHIPSFVCSVARCCGRGSSSDGFEHLKTMLERLIAISSLDSSEGSAVLEQIVADSAFIYADHLPDTSHLQFAQRIMANMHRSFSKPKTSSSKGEPKYETGFRWEEGINEWVMATPAVRLTGRQKRRLSSVNEDSDSETSVRSGRKRCKTETTLHERARIRTNLYNRISELAPYSPKEYYEDIPSQVLKDYPTRDEALRTQYPLRAPPQLTRSKLSERTIGKMRRMGCELLCSSQNWISFEHSDDELNSTMETSSHSAQDALEDLPDPIKCYRRVSQKKSFLLDKRAEGGMWYPGEQSEDELGL